MTARPAIRMRHTGSDARDARLFIRPAPIVAREREGERVAGCDGTTLNQTTPFRNDDRTPPTSMDSVIFHNVYNVLFLAVSTTVSTTMAASTSLALRGGGTSRRSSGTSAPTIPNGIPNSRGAVLKVDDDPASSREHRRAASSSRSRRRAARTPARVRVPAVPDRPATNPHGPWPRPWPRTVVQGGSRRMPRPDAGIVWRNAAGLVRPLNSDSRRGDPASPTTCMLGSSGRAASSTGRAADS